MNPWFIVRNKPQGKWLVSTFRKLEYLCCIIVISYSYIFMIMQRIYKYILYDIKEKKH